MLTYDKSLRNNFIIAKFQYINIAEITRKTCWFLLGSEPVSLIVPVQNQKDKYIVTIKRKIAIVTWDGQSDKVSNIEILGEVEDTPETKDNRFNDGKADPTGRLWLGTMGSEPILGKVTPNAGALYTLESGQSIKKHLDKISISNGLAWNIELKKFYYIDSPERKIFQFDYDETTGAICKLTHSSNNKNQYILFRFCSKPRIHIFIW